MYYLDGSSLELVFVDSFHQPRSLLAWVAEPKICEKENEVSFRAQFHTVLRMDTQGQDPIKVGESVREMRCHLEHNSY